MLSSCQFTLVGGFDGEQCVAIMSYRTLFDFVHGKHLCVDDLFKKRLSVWSHES